jgi:hypothetical protein
MSTPPFSDGWQHGEQSRTAGRVIARLFVLTERQLPKVSSVGLLLLVCEVNAVVAAGFLHNLHLTFQAEAVAGLGVGERLGQ